MIAADLGANAAIYLKGVRLIWSDYGYYLYNAHGDVVQLLGEDGTVIRAYDYDAFGIEKGEAPAASDTNPYRYSGEYTDLESGYNYLRARYYDPQIGRFITADNHWNVGNMLYGDDPIKFGGIYVPLVAAIIQSGNLYVYCGNNPVARIDSTGGFWETIFDIVSLGFNVADLPVDYIVRDGNTLILNTRTSQALTQAGISRSQWNAINRTGNDFYEDLLTGQLSRNRLTLEGIETVVRSSGVLK